MVNTLEIQQALQDALPDRRFTVKTRLNNDELIIVINRSRRSEIDYQDLTKVVENQLMDWPLEGIKKLKFFGRIHYHNQPEWQKVFEINENRSEKKNERGLNLNMDRIMASVFKSSSNKLNVKMSSKLMMIKLALLGAGVFTLIDGVRLVGKDEITGFYLLSIAAVLVTGLAVVEAIDVLYQEIKCRQ